MHRQSKMCLGCYRKKQARPDNYIKRACLVCDNPFIVHKSQIERGQGNYCSRSCARVGSPTRQRESPTVICATCGKKFHKYHAEIRKTKGKYHFCSLKCWYEWNQGNNHYLWQGGQHERLSPEGRAWRKRILEREQGHCRLCLNTEQPEAHHIRMFSRYPNDRWKLENGILLCSDCHRVITGEEEDWEELLHFWASLPHRIVYTPREFAQAVAELGIPDDNDEPQRHPRIPTRILQTKVHL